MKEDDENNLESYNLSDDFDGSENDGINKSTKKQRKRKMDQFLLLKREFYFFRNDKIGEDDDEEDDDEEDDDDFDSLEAVYSKVKIPMIGQDFSIQSNFLPDIDDLAVPFKETKIDDSPPSVRFFISISWFVDE